MDTFARQVQYYFKHKIDLLNSAKTHHLAFVKQYLPTQNQQIRFHYQIEDDDRSYNIEFWKKNFYEISRDCIMPIYNIYCQFIPSNFTIGIRKPIKYMAVISIIRHFYV